MRESGTRRRDETADAIARRLAVASHSRRPQGVAPGRSSAPLPSPPPLN